jgi:hypothetical protein
MSQEQIESFESAGPMIAMWPEIGSRAFIRIFQDQPKPGGDGWIELQAERYRYLVMQLEGLMVRTVMSEYLACEVFWL